MYPRLFAWPPARSVLHLLERLAIGLLVAAVLLELFTGLLNTLQWYPWPFPFRQTHYWTAWTAVGALLVHLAVKAPVITANWRRVRTAAAPAERRAFLTATAVAVGAVTLTTAGQSVPWLRAVDLFAPRRPGAGGSLPVNRTAAQAGTTAVPADWQLVVDGPAGYRIGLDALRALPQTTAELPISCVEGWSANARWTGVRLADLLRRAGVPVGSTVRITSLEADGPYRVTEMPAAYADDPLTLLALALDGHPLTPDHGFPARIIAPNRPGVLQTKWVARIEVV